MLDIVHVELHDLVLLGPLDEVSILYAVHGRSRRLRQSAQWELDLGREEPHGARKARRDAGKDNPCVALEPLRAPVNERLDRRQVQLPVVVVLEKAADRLVDPAPGLHGVQPEDDDVEALVELWRFVLDPAEMRDDLDPLDPFLDPLGRHDRLWLPDVLHPKQELPVEVAHVDSVHINHLNVPERQQGQVLEQLAAQATRTNHKNPAEARAEEGTRKHKHKHKHTHTHTHTPVHSVRRRGRERDCVCVCKTAVALRSYLQSSLKKGRIASEGSNPGPTSIPSRRNNLPNTSHLSFS
mmetsp:Transcript_9176/g.26096  ORF Transcript_9176/g.26096 Transcript_9176/m.26096 type:complete len:296 (-) Transcript_9176:534-1421(-)